MTKEEKLADEIWSQIDSYASLSDTDSKGYRARITRNLDRKIITSLKYAHKRKAP